MHIPPMLPPEPTRRDLPPYLSTAAPVEFAGGFYPEETPASEQPFRWMTEQGQLTFVAASVDRYLELAVQSEFRDGSQLLIVNDGAHRLPLTPGIAPLSIDVPAGAATLTLSVNKIFPAANHPGDNRTLSVRVQSALLHTDAARHRHITHQYANGVLNLTEMLDGTVALSSTPRSLGIDMYGVCNVKPPCVYCEWDWNKTLEGDFVDAPFGVETLNEWGAFFENSASLVNCSIGEPFMMKNIDELLDAFGDGGKVLEMTSNGQILTDRNIQKLLGRPIDLYVSLDAATPETYAKLRNNRFEALVANLRRLIDAKGGPGHLPRVYLVFMPMKVNVHELDQFIRLCADLRVDQLVLRPLNYSEKLDLNWERGGYRFDYRSELLPFEQLVWVSGRAKELCRRLQVALSDQMNFGGSMGAAFEKPFEAGRLSVAAEPTPQAAAAPESLGGEHQPACTEPWKSFYILRRGVFPCCYGGAPIAPMDQYRQAWNSPLVQDIRRELAHGRFHTYCLGSPACPIVRKADQSRPPVTREVVRAGQWLKIRTRRVLTEPEYVRKHVGNLLRKLTGR